jgi:hypothetical protein
MRWLSLVALIMGLRFRKKSENRSARQSGQYRVDHLVRSQSGGFDREMRAAVMGQPTSEAILGRLGGGEERADWFRRCSMGSGAATREESIERSGKEDCDGGRHRC